MTKPNPRVLHLTRGHRGARENFVITMPKDHSVKDLGQETIAIVNAEGGIERIFRTVRDFHFEGSAVTVEDVTNVEPVARDPAA